jgi:hypothetical protein
MKDAQKPNHLSLNSLITKLADGLYVIPDFQREFEWQPWDIRELMRSIFLDYYIGSLLLWKGKDENFKALSCEPIYGYSGEENDQYIVLDGQQRLTAIYYAFLAPGVPLPNRASQASYYIKVDEFMAGNYDEAFNYEWLSQRWSKMLANQRLQFEDHIFPLSIVGSGGWDLPNWVQNYQKYWQEKSESALAVGDLTEADRANYHAINAGEFGEHLRGITQQYQISYIELDREIALDKVCDIFTQINSRGVRLDVFDLMNALLVPKGLQLKHMWRRANPRLEFVDTPKMNVYILQVMSLLRQAYCSPKYLYFLIPGEAKPVRDPDGTRRKEVLVPDKDGFQRRWNEAVNALESAVNLLRHPQEFGVISPNYLPYVSILPVFAALQAHVKTLDSQLQLDAQRKIRHWYWASVFTNRYSGSVESTSARDFLDMKAWIEDDSAAPALLEEFNTRFRSLDLRKETKRGTTVYNGVFNLLVLQGARDWVTGNVPQYGDLDDHHIVPDSWGKANLEGSLIHTILNRTPLTGNTNRHIIGDRLPNQYLPEMLAQNGEARVRAILESHFISPEAQAILMRSPFTVEDFDAFIAERQKTIQQAIENLLIKERLDLSPQLRELDQKIEDIELGLRERIETVLHGNVARIPTNISGEVNKRVQRALRKNAALNAERYETLEGRLEFFDLRELQGVITNSLLWSDFEPLFRSKGTLSTKFDQLAELRNSIRHSRHADEVTRMEGEAAILWFRQVLGA